MENSDIIFFRIQSQFFGNVSTLCRNEFRNAKVILRWEYGNNHEKWAEIKEINPFFFSWALKVGEVQGL